MTDKTTIARPYARAAFAAAQAHGVLAAWSDALHTAAAVVHDPRVADLLGNPRVTAAKLADFMVAIGGEKLGKEWHELVLMLAQNGGKERSVDEHEKLFAQSGLKLSAGTPTQSPFSLIEAVAA